MATTQNPKSTDAGFAGVPVKRLITLATKLTKLRSSYKISQAIEALVGDGATSHAVLRYLVAAGHLDPTSSGPLLTSLVWGELDEAAAVAIAEALARRDEAGRDVVIRSSSHTWLPGWPEELDGAIYSAYPLAPSAFAERMPRYAATTRRGLAFVARRRGARIDHAVAAEIVEELARAQATGYGLTTNVRCPYVDDAGEAVALEVRDLASLRALALRFGAAHVWDRALAAAALRNEWGLIENVASAIEQLPLAEITRMFATRTTMFGDSAEAAAHIAAIMDRRDDTPDALLAELSSVPASEHAAARLRVVYADAADRKRRRA
jgi:hypothetical protein